jgi:aminoglycoside phosphotransferase family enzyme
MVDLKEVEKVIGPIENTVETHMSVIHMGNDLVAKEIKSVDLGFVDLRPIEARRVAAIKTAEIDAAYCPDLNSRAVEIDGVPFIVMRRFDSTQGLDHLYEENKVTEEYARQIGILFAEAHRRAKAGAQISQVGYFGISANWEELFVVSKDFAKAVGKTIAEEDYREIVDGIRVFISENDSYFQERRDRGFMRQCHGDGHAGNMFVESDKVKIFDGIGFKDGFSYMDPISDVAFPIMDAMARDRRDLAEAIKTSYVAERTEDSEGIEKLLDFYICYRAFVRGQISTMIANGMEGEDQKKMLQSARKYYGLALEYLPRK